jgi:DNA helicase-2/ATP-dependent DNA helicase PcrA
MKNNDLQNDWNQLSPIQQKAASWNEGPLLVLAGPGSGKTRVLTCRIGRLIAESEDKNFRILALTFTNKAADEMRIRVNQYVPGKENRVFLGTFHSFCADVLRQHGTHISIKPNFEIYSLDSDLQEIAQDAMDDLNDSHEDIHMSRASVLSSLQHLKSNMIFPENCISQYRNRQFGEIIERLYRAYDQQMMKRNVLDFDSLIINVYKLFSKFPAFARHYRTVYPYICIDEFQDTNKAQYMLLESLLGDSHRNLFIVADDDQIIYQWNGASYDRLKLFKEKYNPELLQLPMNYRCPSEIVELANRLIQYNASRTPDKEPLQSFFKEKNKNTVRLLEGNPTSNDEVQAVACDINTLHSREPSSVVILARNRKLLESAEQALAEEGLKAIILQRKNEFQSKPFIWLHSILRLANNTRDKRRLEYLCGSYEELTGTGINPDDVVAITEEKNYGYLQNWVSLTRNKNNNIMEKEILSIITQNLVETINIRTFCDKAIKWLDEITATSGETEDRLQEEAFPGYENEKRVWEELMREIIQSLGDELSLEAFLQHLQMYSKEPLPSDDSVRLMTIHGSKGKEFRHVYLIGMVEDELPSFQSIKKGEKSPEMEEERRNCFVAITRTMETLTLSYAEKYRGWAKKPSRFLFEMGMMERC